VEDVHWGEVGLDRLFDRVVNFCHSWGLRDLTCVVLSGGYLARFKVAQVIVTLSDMSDSCLLLSTHSNSIFIMLYLFHEMDVDYLVVDEVLNINID
jgi:hypothetical protein